MARGRDGREPALDERLQVRRRGGEPDRDLVGRVGPRVVVRQRRGHDDGGPRPPRLGDAARDSERGARAGDVGRREATPRDVAQRIRVEREGGPGGEPRREPVERGGGRERATFEDDEGAAEVDARENGPGRIGLQPERIRAAFDLLGDRSGLRAGVDLHAEAKRRPRGVHTDRLAGRTLRVQRLDREPLGGPVDEDLLEGRAGELLVDLGSPVPGRRLREVHDLHRLAPVSPLRAT